MRSRKFSRKTPAIWAGLAVALLVIVALNAPLSEAAVRLIGNVERLLWMIVAGTLFWPTSEMKCPVCDK